jgi:hypothetical protein
MTTLHTDVPLHDCPPVEQCVCGVFVFDRTRSVAVTTLREVLGSPAADRVLQHSGRWLFLAIGRGGAGVMAVDSELDVIEAHRGLLHAPRGAGHVEVFHYLDSDLRQRIIEDSQSYMLRAVPAEGHA